MDTIVEVRPALVQVSGCRQAYHKDSNVDLVVLERSALRNGATSKVGKSPDRHVTVIEGADNEFVATVMAPEKTPWAIERSLADCHEQLAAFEARLASRVYMLGERFTILDALFFPMVASSAKRLEGGLERYPNLARYEAFIAQRPGVQRGMANG